MILTGLLPGSLFMGMLGLWRSLTGVALSQITKIPLERIRGSFYNCPMSDNCRRKCRIRHAVASSTGGGPYLAGRLQHETKRVSANSSAGWSGGVGPPGLLAGLVSDTGCSGRACPNRAARGSSRLV